MSDRAERALARLAAAGDVRAEVAGIVAGLRSGSLLRERVAVAAWLGYRPAREALGADAPPLTAWDWINTMTNWRFLAELRRWGLQQPDGSSPVEACPQAMGRIGVAWARAALPQVLPEHEAGARRAVEAAERYLLAPGYDTDIPLDLMFIGTWSDPACELAAFACHLADPIRNSQVPAQAKRAALRVFCLEPGAFRWPCADVAPALVVLRPALIPWALGWGDPILEPRCGQGLLEDEGRCLPFEGADWEELDARLSQLEAAG